MVIDGGPTAAADEARAAAGARSNVRVIENDVNRGKGYSVRRGFSEARGDRLAFIDADLSLPIEGLGDMMARFDAGADVVIASRTAPGSRVEGAPPAGRDLMSKLFNLAVQALAVTGDRRHAVRIQGFHRAAPQRRSSASPRAIDSGLTSRRCILRGRTASGSTNCPSPSAITAAARSIASATACGCSPISWPSAAATAKTSQRRSGGRSRERSTSITVSSEQDACRARESCAADRDARSSSPRGRRSLPNRAACRPE